MKRHNDDDSPQTSSSNNEDWRNEKHAHMLDTGIGADVFFMVGRPEDENKELISAHKYMLSAVSDVFQAQFLRFGRTPGTSREGIDEEHPVEVPDVGPSAFHAMLRFIYTNELGDLVNKQNFWDVYYAGEKYMIPALVKACRQLLLLNGQQLVYGQQQQHQLLGVDNMLSMLKHAQLHEDETLISHCWTLVDNNFDSIDNGNGSSKEFFELDQSDLCTLFSRDTLVVKEEILFYWLFHWISHKCEAKGLDRKVPENKQSVGGEAIYQIRFPLIPLEKFNKFIVPTDLLTKDDMLAMYIHYYNNCDAYKAKSQYPNRFNSQPRRASSNRIFLLLETGASTNQQQQQTPPLTSGDQLDEQIRQLLRDEQVPQYARTLIDLLARELSLLGRESQALKLALGPERYKHLVRRGANSMLEEESGWMPDMLSLICVALFIFVCLYALRQWIKGGQFTEKVSARGKVAIVTGANSGIGKQLARELNMRYVKVYMLCRSLAKGNEAARELFSRYGCDMTRLCVRHCDLSDFLSVHRFVDEFSKEEDKLDILVNNAGIMGYPRFEKTADGHELTWQSNHLGHFLLTELLLPKLELSEEGGRIVNVSSRVHLAADTVAPEICDSPQHFSRWIKTYARSKLANVMHCVALTKRIRANNSASRVTANACHPGTVDTSLIRQEWFQKYIKPVFAPLIWFVLKTEQDGAQTPLYLALSKKIAGVSGRYFSDCKEAKMHPLAEDELACEIMYNNSLEQCNLDRSYTDG